MTRFIMVGPYAPLAQIVKRSHVQGWRPLFLTVSFVGTEALIKEAGKDAEGTVITQVVPLYSQERLPTVALYKKLFKQYNPGQKPSPTSFEGFIDAMVLVEGLRGAGRDLTRSKFIKALESTHNKDVGLGDLKLTYGPRRHKGFETVYPTVVRNNEPIMLTDWHSLK
jgi:ABC-type branched-subunit amino acid transport system substrate-binding protein